MTKISHDKSKFEIIDFLRRHLNYRPFRSPQKSQYDNYLYNVNAENFQIIFLTTKEVNNVDEFVVRNRVIENLINKLQSKNKNKHLKLRVLTIILGDHGKKEINRGVDKIMFVNQDWGPQLEDVLPTIKSFFQNRKLDIKDVQKLDLMNEINDSNSRLSKEMRNFQEKTRWHNLIVTWIIIVVFVLIPLLLLLFKNYIGITTDTSGAFALTIGGLNRDLLIGFNQWFRLWTFPVASSNIFILIIGGFAIAETLRYLEIIIKKWKFLIILGVGLPLSGFILAVSNPAAVIGGILPLAAIVYGTFLMVTIHRTEFVIVNARLRVWFAPLILILYPFFAQEFFLYLVFGLCFVVGAFIGYMLIFDYAEIRWTIIFPILILLILLVTPIVLLFVNPLVWPVNQDAFSSLNVYYQNGLISKSYITEVLKNYYHIYDPSKYFNF